MNYFELLKQPKAYRNEWRKIAREIKARQRYDRKALARTHAKEMVSTYASWKVSRYIE